MFPVAALIVLVGLALLRGAPSKAERAFLATAVAAIAGIAMQASLFASSFAFRIEERNMFCVFPLLFIAFALWLHRGAPRRPWPLAALAAAAPAAAVVFALPLRELLGIGILSDTFALIPLLRLSQILSGGVDTVVRAADALSRRLRARVRPPPGSAHGSAPAVDGRLLRVVDVRGPRRDSRLRRESAGGDERRGSLLDRPRRRRRPARRLPLRRRLRPAARGLGPLAGGVLEPEPGRRLQHRHRAAVPADRGLGSARPRQRTASGRRAARSLRRRRGAPRDCGR